MAATLESVSFYLCCETDPTDLSSATKLSERRFTDRVTDGGNQQFTAQRMKFNNCKTAVQIFWDWGFVSGQDPRAQFFVN
jgi:hypothetical protein